MTDNNDLAPASLLPADRFQRIMILIAAGLLVAFLILIAFLRFGPYVERYYSGIPFNERVWKQAENAHDPIRAFMVDNLLTTRPLIGKSRAEIDSLLGTPPQRPSFAKYDYVYWLGPERSFIPIDSEWLGIKFDEDHVVEIKLLND